MNDQDRDLILALAAGQLSEADAAAASARIAADPELAKALADQELALASLSTIPGASMTAAERHELRSSLITQLNLESAPATATATTTAAARSRSIKWWQPVVGLAAAAAVVAAVVVLPNQGGDDMSDVAALQSAPDTAATEQETLSEDGDGETNAAGSADTTATTQALGEVTTTAPASDGVSEAPEATADTEADSTDQGTDERAEPEQPQVRSEDVLSATEGDDTPEEAEAGVRSSGFALDPFDTARTSEVDSCLEQLGPELPQGDVIPLGTQVSEGREILFIGITDAAGIAAVAAIDLGTCQILEIAQR